jgi:hypothetical protein
VSKPDAAAVIPLVKALKKRYGRPEPIEREPEWELVYCFLLWEGLTSRANAAIKRLEDHHADINELRVSRLEDLVALIGKTYPHVEERTERLLLSLHDLYNREHAVSLAACVAMSKRDGRKYLESLDAIPPYVSARASLVILGAHAVPVDDRLLEMLIEAEVLDASTDVERAIAKLERAIKSGDGPEAHDLLQAWAEDADGPIKPGSRSGAKRSARKTATTG